MSKRRIVRFVVLGAAAVTVAGYSAYAKRANRALASDQAVSFADPSSDLPQISNRASKANRLLVRVALADPAAMPAYALASAQPEMDFPRPANPAIAATPAIPESAAMAEPKIDEPKTAAEPRAAEPKPIAEPKAAAVAPIAPAPEKPKKLPPSPAPPVAGGVLDDGQISGLKGRLRLTSDQAEYWPAVEAALRDVVRTQLRGTRHAFGGKTNIDVNSAEVQKLIWAAMPLLMRLREDQKSEVRKLARVIGLEQVASQI